MTKDSLSPFGVTRREFVGIGLGALMCAALGSAGCGASQAGTPAGSGAGAPGVPAAEGRPSSPGQPNVVVDCVGRQVEVPENPERISVLDSFAGELAVIVGAGPLLVGVPTGVASDEILREIFPGLAGVAAPMANGSINIEEFMAGQPQVAIVKRSIYGASGQEALLDATGVPYVVVGYETMAEQIAMMRLVGRACGEGPLERAEALAALYESIIEQCGDRVSGISQSERVRVYHAINALTMTDGARSLGADWVAAAGCVDVSAEHAEAATAIDFVTTLEQVFEWDPDAFICNSADTTDYLLSKESCAGLRAVAAGKCYTIPVGATRWGQRGSVETYLAMLWLGATMYPECYEDFDLKRFVTDYYRDYLGIEVDDDTYALMLSGRGLRKLPQTT